MGKGEGARDRQPAMQSLSTGLPVRAGEELARGCIDPVINKPEETTTESIPTTSDAVITSANADTTVTKSEMITGKSDADVNAKSNADVDAKSNAVVNAKCNAVVNANTDNTDKVTKAKCAVKSPTFRRPLSNDYKRLDNLVLLKQEIKKLHSEIKELRDGERRRLDDMRSQSEAHRTELHEISKLNNRESLKLMCELRSKDRVISKLEKELGQLRTHCEKLTSKQREESVTAATAKKSKKQEMPPHTAKDRAEEQPPAPPEPPDTGPPGLTLTEPWRTRPEEKRKKFRNTGRSILEFINSELLATEPPHKTVVFIGDQTDRQITNEASKEVLRIDISPDVPIKNLTSVSEVSEVVKNQVNVYSAQLADKTGVSKSQADKPKQSSVPSGDLQTNISRLQSTDRASKDIAKAYSLQPVELSKRSTSVCLASTVDLITNVCPVQPPTKVKSISQLIQTEVETNDQTIQTQIDVVSNCSQTDQMVRKSTSVQTELNSDSDVFSDESPVCDVSSSIELSPTVIQNENGISISQLEIKQDSVECSKQTNISNVAATSAYKFPSKLPVLERSRSEDMSLSTTHVLTKVVSLETLYGVLMEEHLGLVTEAREQTKRHASDKQKLSQAELKLHEVLQALETLQKSNRDLETRLQELTEENDLLEFRLLEMEDQPTKRAVSRGSDTRWDITETQDDISDSGLMSLPTSEDEQYSLCSSEGSSEVIKCRLLSMCRHTDSATEKTCLEDTIALLRFYESRLQQLDTSLSHQSRLGECTESKSGRIVATVPPFSSEPPVRCAELKHKEIDPLEESGIFEETQYLCRSTQTDPVADPPGDLSQEIQKLVHIREVIEESKTVGSETKELLYLRDRLAVLEHRLQQYECLPQHKETRVRLELEAALRSQVQRFEERVEQLEEENTKLEEICSELEEQENDTRLRCQKLEAKVSSLGEKKIGLKAQLELNSRTIAELKNSLMEEERKRNEARQAASKMEGLVHQYEKKNFELEERETEVRYRLQVLESTLPAIMMWNMWRMMAVMQIGEREREAEITAKLKALETELVNETTLLEQSRKAEQELKDKIAKLEQLLESTDGIANKDQELAETIKRMTEERSEKDKRIQELELREKLYQETLQQADSMFAEMENDYAKQIIDKDNELRDKELKLTESQTKMRRLSKERETSSHLQDKLHILETDLKSTKENLSRKEQERSALKYEEERLRSELVTCLDEIQCLKTTLSYTKSELDGEKKSAKQLQELLERLEYDNGSIQQEHEIEVKKYKKQIKKLDMELLESEVTINELKQQVNTLEVAVKDLKEELRLEKDKNESLRLRLESELEESNRRIELLEGHKHSSKTLSLRDELDLSTWQQVRTEETELMIPDESCATSDETCSRPIPAARTTSARRIKKLIERIEQSIPTPHPRKIKESHQT